VPTPLRWKRLAPLVLVGSLLAAGCGGTPRAVGPVHLPTPPQTGSSSPAIGLPLAGAAPNPVPSGWPSGVPTPDGPGTPGPIPAVRTGGANWPATARSTFDPSFTLHVPILMYHRIVSPAEAGPALPGLVVDPGVFNQEMSLLAGAGWHTITLADLQLDLATGQRPPPHTFVITIDDGHLDGLSNALPILLRYGFVATYFVVMNRIDSPLFLSAADLLTLAADGMEIADHTMNHEDVARLHGTALAYQIDGAARAIEQITGRAPTSFAYPSGEWSLEAVGALESGDLGIAVTTREGVLETWANRFLVPRLRVAPSLTPEQLLRLLMGYAIG
jgi:peptidoglycan/xylan/chitin deacetylase (PgdA/CDA1 family)